MFRVAARSFSNRRVQKREAYMRALLENVSDVIAILDAEARIKWVSPSIERSFQYGAVDLLGSNPCKYIHHEDRDRVSIAIRRLIETPSAPAFSETYRFRRKDGVWRTLETVGHNLLDDPQVGGVVLSSRDVTDRQKLEQEVQLLNRLTSLGRLAAHVAHEFNNVLMGVQPMVEVIQKSAADPALQRVAELACGSIARGKRITTDILRYGRPAQPTIERICVGELIRQVSDEIRQLLPETIRIDASEAGMALMVSADRAQLAQVLINLALNARDAMQVHGGTLTIDAQLVQRGDPPQTFIHFTLTDTGEGIATEDLPYVFEPLFTTKRNGTGLGLSVVFQIVAAHGGHVSVDSEPGLGSTFHVFIPAFVDGSSVQGTDNPAKTNLSRTLRVLIAEDDKWAGRGLQLMLEAEGVEAHVVTRGAEVLPAIATLHPDLLLLDLNLPDEDGRDTHARVAAESPLPVIFSSGHAFEHEINAILDNPRTGFLMKPYSLHDLMQTICRVVDSKERL